MDVDHKRILGRCCSVINMNRDSAVRDNLLIQVRISKNLLISARFPEHLLTHPDTKFIMRNTAPFPIIRIHRFCWRNGIRWIPGAIERFKIFFGVSDHWHTSQKNSGSVTDQQFGKHKNCVGDICDNNKNDQHSTKR